MPQNDTENKVIAYWPVLVGALVFAVGYGSLNQRVSANENAIFNLRSDHDILIDLRRRVEDIANTLGVPKNHE